MNKQTKNKCEFEDMTIETSQKETHSIGNSESALGVTQ